jgi:hypothetical protein
VERDAVAQDADLLGWCLHQLGVTSRKLAALRPDFLIISPPKTGSTWLAANLRCHPDVFVPAAKEVRYFGPFFDWLDLNWYLAHFAPAAGRVKGEASPSYALLPGPRLRLIRRLMPDVKVIFLMRDPVARAWSHAKHTWRYREANFAARGDVFDATTEAQWRANFTHDWPLACGDYLGQLRRWLTVFPREQLYVGFYESIASDPHALLREVFAFLGIRADVDLSAFPVAERILPGLAGEPSPALERSLHGLLHGRTRQLSAFLRDRLNLEAPSAWARTLQPRPGPPARSAPAAAFDDRRLPRVLRQEEGFPSAQCWVREGYRGYNLFFRGGSFYAVAQESAPTRAGEGHPAALPADLEDCRYFTAPSLAELKECVDRHVLERAQAGLRRARRRIARLERGLAEAVGGLRRLEAQLLQRWPWYAGLLRVLRVAGRRLRAPIRDKQPGTPPAVVSSSPEVPTVRAA